jgi:hypothetical protein
MRTQHPMYRKHSTHAATPLTINPHHSCIAHPTLQVCGLKKKKKHRKNQEAAVKVGESEKQMGKNEIRREQPATHERQKRRSESLRWYSRDGRLRCNQLSKFPLFFLFFNFDL